MFRLEHDRLQMESEYLMQQQMLLSKSSPLNEIVQFKKDLDKSERQREQLSDHLEVRRQFFHERKYFVFFRRL